MVREGSGRIESGVLGVGGSRDGVKKELRVEYENWKRRPFLVGSCT